MGSLRTKSAHKAKANGKGNLYEDDDEPIKLGDQDDVLRSYVFHSSVRSLIQKEQNVEKLLQTMSSQWGMEDKITANDQGNGKFLFKFSSEEDLNYVLRKGLFHYNFCMFVLVHWGPIVHDDYPWTIPFWVQLIGFRLHLWTVPNLRNIGGRIGHVDAVELCEGRMLIHVDSRRPLKFSRKVEYEGDEVKSEIKFDMLFKQYTLCGLLSHEKGYCPTIDARSRTQPHPERSDFFSRMQLPQELDSHLPLNCNIQQNDNQYHQASLKYKEQATRQTTLPYSRHDTRVSSFENRGSHPRSWKASNRRDDRVIRHHDDYSRRSRYGGARYEADPCDRKKLQTWRAKPRSDIHGPLQIVQAKAAVSLENFPYEQTSGSSLQMSNDTTKSDAASSSKRLASTIVTPSRMDHLMEDNVMVRNKGAGQSLTFSHLSEHVPLIGDEQIIGA